MHAQCKERTQNSRAKCTHFKTLQHCLQCLRVISWPYRICFCLMPSFRNSHQHKVQIHFPSVALSGRLKDKTPLSVSACAHICLRQELNIKPQAAITQTSSGCNCSIWLVRVVLVLEALCCFSRAHSDIYLHSNNMSLVKLSQSFLTHSHLDICGRHRSNAALCTCSKHINIKHP